MPQWQVDPRDIQPVSARQLGGWHHGFGITTENQPEHTSTATANTETNEVSSNQKVTELDNIVVEDEETADYLEEVMQAIRVPPPTNFVSRAAFEEDALQRMREHQAALHRENHPTGSASSSSKPRTQRKRGNTAEAGTRTSSAKWMNQEDKDKLVAEMKGTNALNLETSSK